MGYDADVFVVGGGPAGLAAAIAARGNGLTVIVADGGKPPISKACGEGLLPDGVAALRRLGITLGAADGYVLRGIRFQDTGSSVSADFRGAFGFGVRREVLHRRMVERAEQIGVSFAWNSPVTALLPSGAMAGGNKIRARWVVGADGIRSRVSRWAGLDGRALPKYRFARRQRYGVKAWTGSIDVYWHGDIQLYVTPVGPEEVCVAVLSGKPNLRVGCALQRFPQLARQLAGAHVASRERGAVTRMFGLKRVSRGNVALVGDAAGTVDAITGEGLSLSFRQAEALGNALAAGDLSLYERAHPRLLRRPRLMANLLLFLGRQREIRKRTFQTMQAAPNIFDCMLAYHVGETRPLELAATGAQFSWRFLTA